MDVEAAVVVGGGIGGLASAVALQRRGWEVTVCERALSLEPVGAGLTIWPNAVRALERLGLGTGLRDRAWPLPHSGVRRPDGRWLSQLQGGQVVHRHGVPLLTVLRADLIELLAGALRPGALRLGTTAAVVDAGDAARPATVRVGDRLMSVDLIVGADGVGSGVRRGLWPMQPPAHYSGYAAWRGLVRGFPGVAGASETWGPGERFGVVPLSDDLVYVYATANAPPREQRPDQMAELRRRFGGWHDPIPELLEGLDPSSVQCHDVLTVRPALKQLHHGRVALLGDAAHAMEPNLGQGACLAIEDAVVLAHSMGADGLVGYSQARAGRVTRLARQSALLGRLTQAESRGVAVLRDAVTRWAPERLAVRGFDDAAGWWPPAERPVRESR